jgi:hypothetical protein
MDLKLETKADASKPNRPKPSVMSYYARFAASEWRRFRSRLTRDSVIAFLKNFGWTVLLTVLIWIYAEREEEVPVPGQPIPIEVKSQDSSKVVTLDPDEYSITCDLRGPQSNLDQFRETLQPSSPIVIDVDTANLPNQENRIPTLETLMANARFKKAGITIEKCIPPMLTVYVDKLETRTLPVAAPANIAGLRSATFSPSTVSVTGPSHAMKNLTQVTAEIAGLPILDQPGPHPPVKVPLSASSGLTYSPGEVEATLTVAEKDVTYTCTNVPVWIEIPPKLADQWSVSFVNSSGFVPQLEVIGPPEQIDRLRGPRAEYHPVAVLEIGPDNLSDTNPVPLRVENLPDGVRVNGPAPQISFTATRRG